MMRAWLYIRLFYHNIASLTGLIMMAFGIYAFCIFFNLATTIFGFILAFIGLLILVATDLGRESLKAYDEMTERIKSKQSDFRFRLTGFVPYCVVVGYRVAIEDAVEQKLIEKPIIKGVTW